MKHLTQTHTVEWVTVAVVFFAHASLLWMPQINLEWAFSDAINYFEYGRPEILERYFTVQANTLGLSYLSYLGMKLPFVADPVLLPRLYSALGILFLGSALLRFCSLLEVTRGRVLLILFVLLSPLIWVYSGRGTADFLPSALALFSISLFWNNKLGRTGTAVAIFLFSLAIILKYHAAALLPLLWMEALSRKNINFKMAIVKLTLVSILVAIGPVLYLVYVRSKFGFWITPPTFQATFQINFSAFSTNLVSYIGYLSALLLPLSVFSIWRRQFSVFSVLKYAAFFCSLFVFGYFLLEPAGEMKFGPFDRFLDPNIVYGILCACSGVLFFLLYDCYKDNRENRERLRFLACMFLGIAVFVMVLSLTRPAQRYLTFVLPLAYFFAVIYTRQNKLLLAAVLALLVMANTYIGFSQYATGTAARELVQEIHNRGLIDQTDPGALWGQAGNLFPFASGVEKQLTVAAGQHPDQLFFAQSSPVPFVTRAFSLVPIE